MFGYPMGGVLLVLGITFGIIALIYALVYGSSARTAKRYRPGRPFEFAPVWFLAQPELMVTGHEPQPGTLALTAPKPSAAGTKGGASGKW